ncbi:hypothetical protein LEP1GSC074_1503 [Leptospira noguchii str. Hook]|uniref:Uncharacterized protein n=1 Tax=Leptospira noguchii serovar Autumnalis str. ZUN142 TaxID=1085540 RepID=M6UQ28_9LEPT|nr:hypothetical protein LEP1GSC041_2057 [Leptospira noguchii str. 2006001870]EMO43144.1 hypothetical protein LEP1GSC186_2614 [Leptospira noguchii serovar Autumnalis str. ZUN142]EMS84147.1 hypothetical protein LEP1GSC074_1503 [Leptospira noguchii str. Hook]TQE77580.1 hypothetical protein FF021_08265 [Leptospira noguchii]
MSIVLQLLGEWTKKGIVEIFLDFIVKYTSKEISNIRIYLLSNEFYFLKKESNLNIKNFYI